MNMNYCTNAQVITFDPFRGFERDFSRLDYLHATLKPYISISEPDEGILSKWSWSPDGKVLTGLVSPNARWLDGSMATAKEIAYSIAMGMQYREFGNKIKIKGFDATIGDESWHKEEYEGIQVLDDKTFQLIFESDIEHLAATIEESLSDDATYNFTWPKRIGNNAFDVIAFHEVVKDDEKYTINVDGHQAEIQTIKEHAYPENSIGVNIKISHEDLGHYDVVQSKNHIISAGMINTAKELWRDVKNRESLVSFIRYAGHKCDYPTVIHADTIVLEGEPGYSNTDPWPKVLPTSLPFKKLKIASGSPVREDNSLRQSIAKLGQESGVSIEWCLVNDSRPDMDVDLLISGGTVVNGRQVWFQDSFFSTPFLKYAANDAILVKLAEESMKKSVSTVPSSQGKIEKFEKHLRKSFTIFPILRHALSSFNAKKAGLRVDFNQNSVPRIVSVPH